MSNRPNDKSQYGPDNPHPLSRMKTELIWEGKYDEYGQRRPIRLPTAALPLQRIETIDEPRDREKALVQTGLFDDAAFAQQAHRDDFRNMLIWGDNKLALAALLEQYRGKVDLIYIDPPFDVGADFTMQVQIGDAGEAIEKEQSILEAVAYRDTWGKGTDSYLHMMYERLSIMRELLSDKGSIYVHCDWRVNSSLRLLIDDVLGADNFRNEVIWHYPGREMHITSKFNAKHDTILFYTKSMSGKINMSAVTIPYTKDERIHTLRRKVHVDEDGKEWVWETRGQASGQEPYKRYIDEIIAQGKPLSDVWDDMQFLRGNHPERVDYSTQKPSWLLERIVKASSKEDSLVLDCFCMRRGTRVWMVEGFGTPPSPPASGGGRSDLPPLAGGLRGGVRAGESSGEVDTRGRSDLPPQAREPSGGSAGLLPQAGVPSGGSAGLLPQAGEPSGGSAALPPLAGGLRGDFVAGGKLTLRPIETLCSGDYVLGHDGLPHSILRTFSRHYRGEMIGVRCADNDTTLWLTADHRVLCRRRVQALSKHGAWSAVPPTHFSRARQLRREQTPPERVLWRYLRGEQLGVAFRRQHPIGPYIADFYTRQVGLVVEVDGALAHGSAEARSYDANRDAYMQHLGLNVLRFPAAEVLQHPENVVQQIYDVCHEHVLEDDPEKQWRYARNLAPGDVVYVGPYLEPSEVVSVERSMSDEEVYDLQVEDAHSYITEVCAVHNCGSGTTLAVAEKLGRRWIGVDLGRYAIHTTRKRLIQVQRELHQSGQSYRSFDVYNLGRYERQWWQFDRLKGYDDEHRRTVLRFYKAAALQSAPHPLLHGTRNGAFVHVDQIDGIFTFENLCAAAQAAQSAGARELHCLAWEFEMELALKKQAVEAETGLSIRLKYIPREIMEPNRTEAQFFEAGYLEAQAIVSNGKVDVKLLRFAPSLAEAPEKEMLALRERAIQSPFDFIDFWAVDFTWRDDKPFEHHWQDFRTRKERKLKTVTDSAWTYRTKGRQWICVKVIDVFGVDTTTVIEVEV